MKKEKKEEQEAKSEINSLVKKEEGQV